MDHKRIAAQLAATLDGFQKTMDPVWDFKKEKETIIERESSSTVDRDAEILDLVDEHHHHRPSGGMMRFGVIHWENFMWRLPCLFLFLALAIICFEWFSYRQFRLNTTGVPNNRNGRVSLVKESYRSKLIRYGIITGLFMCGILFICFYAVNPQTFPRHIFRMK